VRRLKIIGRKALRPRWLVLLLVAAATIPAALLAATSASSAPQIPVSNPAHPVVDASWIYAHNFYESNAFIYKVAGSDGCLPQATTCGSGTQTDPSNNLPANYNGAQEFYSWWKGVGTTHTPQPNGVLGKWITARDHLFPTRTWQLDDAELTIPGATCAGQQVMLASHNDSTPVNAVNPGSSATPMSGMHGGNWGNGSGYDANMGENMNLEELGSVLRWHEVNGTYPARTMKATLYDNEEGGLVGSGDYSAAGGGAAFLAAPAGVGDTNIKVTSVSALNAAGTTGIFGVGFPVAVDDANTENNTVASIGTAAQSTTLTARSAVGDTNVKVASVTGVTVGHQYRVGVPPNDEYPTVASVGTASTATTLAGPAAAGDTNIKVASISGFTVGQMARVDATPNDEYGTVASVGTAAAAATTLAAAASAGDTNVKVTSVTGMTVGDLIKIDTGANLEVRTITSVGTAGSGGTGIGLTSGLTNAHASGAGARDLGTGVTLTAPLTAAHADGAAAQALGTGVTFTAPLTKAHAQGEAAGDLGTGVTLAAPLTAAHPAGSTVNGPTTGLISDSPQGQIIGVFNNDQDGLNYPAPKWGTDHYLNDLVNGGIGPWFNNINATPVSAAPNNIYGTVGIQRLQHNLPAVQAFRDASASAVAQANADLGQKYNFSIPLENPDLLKNTGSVPDNPTVQTRPAYTPGDQALYSPVLDDRTGRTDQVSFGIRGIPSLGDIGQYDSSTDPLVGGNENPYPTAYPSKPTLSGMFGQDSTSDYFSNLNFWASGTVHGPGGYDKPSEGLLRGVEFVATWFSYALASPQEGGAVSQPNRPIAYFEMTPKKPTAQTTVSFDAGFSRTKSGDTSGLTYYWDFGDGSPMVATTNPIIQHTFPTQAAWRDVQLLVAGAGQWNSPEKFGSFRQLEPIDFFPTYYPAVAPASEPLPPTSGGQADPCGALTASEQTALIAEAKDAKHDGGPQPTLRDLASVALRKH
jgi:PKD domain